MKFLFLDLTFCTELTVAMTRSLGMSQLYFLHVYYFLAAFSSPKITIKLLIGESEDVTVAQEKNQFRN